MSEQGRKFDGGKLRYDLVPVLAFEDQVKGLTYGTIKYDDNNWIKVPEGRKRYMAATFRHIQAYRKGELYDKESGCHHLSCAINNLSFIVEKDLQGWEDVPEVVLKTEEDFFGHGKVIAKELDKQDVSQEEYEKRGVKLMFEGDESLITKAVWYPENDGRWIEWRGGIKNVNSCTRVDIRFRDGGELLSTLAGEWNWRWITGFSGSEIVAYRVV